MRYVVKVLFGKLRTSRDNVKLKISFISSEIKHQLKYV